MHAFACVHVHVHVCICVYKLAHVQVGGSDGIVFAVLVPVPHNQLNWTRWLKSERYLQVAERLELPSTAEVQGLEAFASSQ